jgi:hypothetical protein
MSSKPKRNASTVPRATSTPAAEMGGALAGNSARTRKSDVAHTKSISNVANNWAVSQTIGFKRNATSNNGCDFDPASHLQLFNLMRESRGARAMGSLQAGAWRRS